VINLGYFLSEIYFGTQMRRIGLTNAIFLQKKIRVNPLNPYHPRSILPAERLQLVSIVE
jgi:hypothetical protein